MTSAPATRILIVHRYFWPDTPPYASMLRSIAARWASEGHAVTVVTTQPGYNPQVDVEPQPRRAVLDGFQVIRCRLLRERRDRSAARLLNSLAFSLTVLGHILRRHRYDVVMAATFPPIVVAGAARIAASLTGARFVYHNQDVYPEIAKAAGLLRSRVLFTVLRRIDAATSRRADLVVSLSEDMAETQLRRRVRADRIRVINNFDVDPFVTGAAAVPPELAKRPGDFRVLFAGNIGRFQNLEAVIDAARRLIDHPKIRFDFVGDGVSRVELMGQAADLVDRNVHFHGHVAPHVAAALSATADLGLITLGRGLIRAAYPSKTMTYLAAGLPVLLMVEPDSELARMVVDEAIGYVVAPGDDAALAATVLAAYEARGEAPGMKERARKVFEARFERRRTLDRWSALIEEVCPRRPGTGA